MSLESQPDLLWTATLYALGELPVDEASSFELLLAEDQGARDVLAGAVEMLGAIALVGAELPTRRRRPIGRRAFVGAAVLAAAAGLLLALSHSFRSFHADPADASETALAWSSLRGGADADWLAFTADSSPTIATAPAESAPVVDSEAEVEIASSSDRALPSWLLSAASAPRDDAPREED